MKPPAKYEFLSHAADVRVRAYGATIQELFENSAAAMFDIISGNAEIPQKVTVDFALEAETREELLHSWLSELLFAYETRKIVFGEFTVTELDSGGRAVKGHAGGSRFDDAGFVPQAEIKAVTYHGLEIKETKDAGGEVLYSAEVIFDV